jgi:hypothetical protein
MSGAAPRRYAFVLIAASVFATSGDSVSACRCAGTPVCGVLDGDAAAPGRTVFVGLAVESKGPSTRFRVERMLAGQPAAEITLGPDIKTVTSATPNVSSSCGLGFTLKRRYLVYAYRDPETGYLSTSLCSRTTDMSDPRAAADIAYFDARAAGRQTEGWLSGVVEERHYDSSRGPDGSRVDYPASQGNPDYRDVFGRRIQVHCDQRRRMVPIRRPGPWGVESEGRPACAFRSTRWDGRSAQLRPFA